MDVTTLMRRAVAYNRDRVAIITEDQTLTFAEAWRRGVRLANAAGVGRRTGRSSRRPRDNNLGAADPGRLRRGRGRAGTAVPATP